MARIAIVGAGHNGLVCAFYLARAGHQVTIFEQNSEIGGACRNERWRSGAIVSPGANHFGMLNGRVMADMGLGARLSIKRADPQLIVGLSEGSSIALHEDQRLTEQEVARFSESDAGTISAFFADMGQVRSVMQKHAFSLSPSLADFKADLNSKNPKLSDLYVTGSIKKLLDHYFVDPTTKALFSATGFLNNADPDDEGTAFNFVYLSLYETNGSPGWGVPAGGMGRIIELMKSRIDSLEPKVEFFPNTKIIGLLTQNGRVSGIETADNRKLLYDRVVSNADPYNTYVRLGGLDQVQFARLGEPCHTGPCAKFNFTYRKSIRPRAMSAEHYKLLPQSSYAYLPTMKFAHEAYKSALANGYSADPYYEFVSPSGFDRGLVPDALDIGSIYLLFSNYDVVSSWDDDRRDRTKKAIFGRLVGELGLSLEDICEAELLDPVDLERKFGMYKGNVDHGSLVPDNIFEHRQNEDMLGFKGLYLCGAGSFPGGLVSGIPGFNAAHRILDAI